MRWLLPLLLCITGCLPAEAPASLPNEELYHQAQLAYRHNNRQEALRLARLGKVRNRAPDEPFWHWTFGLFEAELMLTPSLEAAVELLKQPVPGFVGSDRLEIRRTMLLADGYRRLSEQERAAELFQQAWSAAEAAGLPALQADIEIRQSRLAHLSNAEREALWRSALRHALEGKDAFQESRARIELGNYLRGSGQYAQAIDEMLPALVTTKESGAVRLAAIVRTNLGECYTWLGYFEKAQETLEEALAFHRDVDFATGIGNTLLTIGNNHFLQNRAQEAVDYYREAFQYPTGRKATIAGNAAAASILAEDWRQAEEWNETARRLKEESGRPSPYVILNAAIIALRGREYDLTEQLLRELEASNPDSSRLKWRIEGMRGELRAEQQRWQESNSHFQRALALIGQDREDVSPMDRIHLLPLLIDYYRGYVHNLVGQKELEEALSVGEMVRAQVLAKRYGIEAAKGNLSIRRVQRHATLTGTVYLVYWLARRSSFLWVFSPAGTGFFTLPGEEKLADLVRRHQQLIVQGRDPIDREFPPSAELYDLLLRPAKHLIPEGSQVVIVPDSELYRLSFGTLPVPDTQPYYWIEKVAISVAPSLQFALEAGSRVAVPGSVLLIADPRTGDAEYPDLLHAGGEMASLETHFSGRAIETLQGTRANPEAYRSASPDKFSIIHFASHADINSVYPLDSFIALSPGPVSGSFKLYAREIQHMPLRAGLVTISACRSAGESVFAGEGLLGLAWAFLYAGAGSVVGGLWDVADRSTSRLMERFYYHLSQGESIGDSLRLAKLDLLESEGNFRKPYYWGPFQHYIGPGGTVAEPSPPPSR